MFKLFVFFAIMAVALAAPGYVGAPFAAPLAASPYAYAGHAAYSAPLAAYPGVGYPAAYSAYSSPLVGAAYYG